MQSIVLVTGGFDPLHSGHINYFKHARELGQRLVVGLNSDAWLARKKGRAFMPWQERYCILSNLNMVDEVIGFDDSDGSGCAAIQYMLENTGPDVEIIFANGGDRTLQNIPEMRVSDPRVRFEFGVGGANKANSSSWILEEWKAPKTRRPWGYYRVLHEESGVKVKELTVDPGASLSMQRHDLRSEFWLVSHGTASVYTLNRSTDAEKRGDYERHEYLHIELGQWHQLVNEDPNPLRIIEIQYGERCEEQDIERKIL